MRIVVDTNRIIAALIKDSKNREILFDLNFEFFCPDYALEEISNHREEIIRKSKITDKEFEILLSLILERIKIVPKEEYSTYLEEASKLIDDIDDVPFIALCLAIKADGIWSEDVHFLKQDKIKIFNTKDLMFF